MNNSNKKENQNEKVNIEFESRQQNKNIILRNSDNFEESKEKDTQKLYFSNDQTVISSTIPSNIYV